MSSRRISSYRKGRGEDPAKHAAMFNRAPSAGQCFHRPCLGTREFPADFALIAEGARCPPAPCRSATGDRDLGWMLHDIDFADGRTSQFFRARLTGGVLDVQACLAENGLVA